METKLLKNIKFENNTIYSSNDSRIDYYPNDCIDLPNEEYFYANRKYLASHKAGIYIKEKENIVLDFKGGTMFMHGALSPFIIRDSSNIEIKNVSICFDRAFHTQMTLVEKGDGYLKCLVDPHFPYRIEDGKFIPYGEYWEDTTIHESCVFFQEFDPVTLRGISWPVVLVGNKDKEAAKLPWGGYGYNFFAYQEGEYVVFKGNVPDYKVGSILVLAMNNRDIASILLYNCKNIKLTNVRIINGLGFGVLPTYTENITIDNLVLKNDEKSLGIIANTADAIHTIACKGDIILKNSYISGMIDDATNFHSVFFKYESKNNNEVIITCPGAAAARSKLIGIDDIVAFYKDNSLEFIDKAAVKDIKVLEMGRLLLTLNKTIKDVPKNSLVENLSSQCNIYIDNCFFGKANSHLRFQTRGKVRMNNCKVEIPVIFTGDTNYWYESSPVNDVVIENTMFDRNSTPIMSIPEYDSSENAKYYHENIVIKDCTFKSEEIAYLRQTKNVKFINCHQYDNKNMSVKISNCKDIEGDERINIYEN